MMQISSKSVGLLGLKIPHFPCSTWDLRLGEESARLWAPFTGHAFGKGIVGRAEIFNCDERENCRCLREER